jgi:hypothetical protein
MIPPVEELVPVAIGLIGGVLAGAKFLFREGGNMDKAGEEGNITSRPTENHNPGCLRDVLLTSAPFAGVFFGEHLALFSVAYGLGLVGAGIYSTLGNKQEKK